MWHIGTLMIKHTGVVCLSLPMPIYFLCPVFLSCLVMWLHSCNTVSFRVFLINENNYFMWTDQLLELHSFHKLCLVLLGTWGQFFLVLFQVV